MTQGGSNEEDEKRLSVVLNEGDPIIMIDNCDLPITGKFLAMILTEPIVQARILGLSERRMLPNVSTIIFTGINLIFENDVVRRALESRIDPSVEHPEDRKFDFSAIDEVKAQRAELLIAALTILRAFKLAKPKIDLYKPMGDYREYDEWIRSAIVWLGQPDPLLTQDELSIADPAKDVLRQVLHCWDNAFGDKSVTTSEIGKAGFGSKTDILEVTNAKQELREMLIEESCKGDWNGQRVAAWFAQKVDKIADGLKFIRRGKTGGVEHWAVIGGKGPVKKKVEEATTEAATDNTKAPGTEGGPIPPGEPWRFGEA
jgi:putative DNA primase/helicase